MAQVAKKRKQYDDNRQISDKTLQMHAENGIFKNDDGEEIEYTTMFVTMMGIKVKVEAKDDTGNLLLKQYFKPTANE